MFKFRDLTVIDIPPNHRMIIACDSSGGIGNKKHDVVQAEPETLGYFTAHVALMELLATGATPLTVVNTLGVEMEDSGVRIIEGIQKALEPLNLKEDIVVTGSTEENIPVSQTSMGITIIGMMEKSRWRAQKVEKGDLAVVLGIPKVGQEVLEDEGREIMSIPLLLELLKKKSIHDILPVGSKGIAYEVGQMAESNGIGYNLYEHVGIDLNKSAGPATCVIVAVNQENYEALKESMPIPVHLVGSFT
ncbi:AIR synthase related protein [Alkaliphilus oremlandii]|uniref:PurM-like N-terminal domain-containing protein n=1 Tax=Alkaliphilus oremlandii (strain OhILAs) TaxID=350688 RepID=A8MIV9_ALKOO|nr:AIR synthase related protein [Alkaliphilus oremlandii]ABW19741.1 conserved hypothetical protein [Alkaliphilus oremlandii OhILAs]